VSVKEDAMEQSEGTVLSVDEVAARYRVGRHTVYRLIKLGKLRAGRFGKHLRIKVADCEAFFQFHGNGTHESDDTDL
jgi:excisionase family DNA binding protein